MIIKYFAWVKDITNKSQEEIIGKIPENVSELKIILCTLYPDLEIHFKNNILRFAVNHEYTSTNKDLKNTDEIAIFPPVSGG